MCSVLVSEGSAFMYQVVEGIVDTSPTPKYVKAELKTTRGCQAATKAVYPQAVALPGGSRGDSAR